MCIPHMYRISILNKYIYIYVFPMCIPSIPYDNIIIIFTYIPLVFPIPLHRFQPLSGTGRPQGVLRLLALRDTRDTCHGRDLCQLSTW